MDQRTIINADSELDARQAEQLIKLADAIESGGPQAYDMLRGVFALLGDKWSIIILLVLSTGRLRHASLRRMLNMLPTEKQISQRILTLRLRTFEHYGLVDRRVSDDVPPKVDYALTTAGRELTDRVWSVINWAHDSGYLVDMISRNMVPEHLSSP